MVLPNIIKYFSESLTFKLFLGMLIYRIGDNIIFDIIPSYLPYFNEIGVQENRMQRIIKEILWSALVIVIIIIIAYMLKLKI
jgi:hypothetical protein